MKRIIKLKENKKGFTLVELLAVMVVLSLILVLVAPNVLNSMNNSKKNALVIYSKKMIGTVKENIEAGKLSGDITTDTVKSYLVQQDLATDQQQYYGCIVVTNPLTNPVYTAYIVDKSNALKVNGKTVTQLTSTSQVTSSADTEVSDVTVAVPKSTIVRNETVCSKKLT